MPQVQSTGNSPLGPAVASSVLERAKAGDRDAFRQVVVLHQARVFGMALRLIGQRADAEELAQDVFLKLFRVLPQITSPEHLTHWLLRTVSHRAIDRLRQQGRQGQQVPLEALDDSTEPVGQEAAHDPFAEAQLRALVLQLQPDARAVMLLRYQEDLDPTDIAELLDMPLPTVKSHLRRSLEWLRIQCKGEHHGF
jgi:RNA polymerase sigma-70 factor, ECF subfamily